MANTRYGKLAAYYMAGGTLDLTSATLRWVLVDTALYTVNASPVNGHTFLSDIPAEARLATSDPLTGLVLTGSTLDADDPVLADPGGGGTAGAMVLYVDTGDPATSRLLLYIDTAAGLPRILDGTNDTFTQDAPGIFQLL